MIRASRLFSVAVLILMAVGPAAAQDLGVPRDGLDRVLLDDGRVIEATVLPREKQIQPLKIAGAVLRVDHRRVREVRLWKDFDPAPRDDAEKAKVAEGYRRWKGKLVPGARVDKLRREEVAEEKARREAARTGLTWEKRHYRTAGKFDLRSNLPEEDVDFWADALTALSKKMLSSLKGGDYTWQRVVVHLYRSKYSLAKQAEEDKRNEWLRKRQEFPRPGDPGERVDIVMDAVHPEERWPLVLGLSSIKLFREMMGWQADDLGGWVLCGVPLYFAGSAMEKGKLKAGLVEDRYLLPFRLLQEADRLPSLESLLKAGNSYWKASTGDGKYVIGHFSSGFAEEHVPYAWLLVHFLLEADRGKHRGGVTNWIRFWMNTKIGSKRTEVSSSFDNQKALFLKYVKMKDIARLEEKVLAYAAELEYRRPSTHLQLALDAWKAKKDLDAVTPHLEKARALAEGDAAGLRLVAAACAKIEGSKERGLEAVVASLAVDPLAAETHAVHATLLEDEAAEREKRLAEALRGVEGPE